MMASKNPPTSLRDRAVADSRSALAYLVSLVVADHGATGITTSDLRAILGNPPRQRVSEAVAIASTCGAIRATDDRPARLFPPSSSMVAFAPPWKWRDALRENGIAIPASLPETKASSLASEMARIAPSALTSEAWAHIRAARYPISYLGRLLADFRGEPPLPEAEDECDVIDDECDGEVGNSPPAPPPPPPPPPDETPLSPDQILAALGSWRNR
jgi:hypothetical protein